MSLLTKNSPLILRQAARLVAEVRAGQAANQLPVIGRDRESMAYYDTRYVKTRRLEKYAVFIKGFEEDPEAVEEIEVLALNDTHAHRIGMVILNNEYAPGAKIASIEHQERGMWS